jgi:hypothetical protein
MTFALVPRTLKQQLIVVSFIFIQSAVSSISNLPKNDSKLTKKIFFQIVCEQIRQKEKKN